VPINLLKQEMVGTALARLCPPYDRLASGSTFPGLRLRDTQASGATLAMTNN
jgi:hypothetical protein